MIDRREPRNGSAAVGDDHVLAALHSTQVAAQVVLQLPDTDLDLRCSYIHTSIVATWPVDASQDSATLDIAHRCYIWVVATTTFRLTPDDERILDAAAARYGSRSAAIRALLADFAVEEQRRQARAELLTDWEAEDGQVTDSEREAMRRHLELR